MHAHSCMAYQMARISITLSDLEAAMLLTRQQPRGARHRKLSEDCLEARHCLKT